MKIKISNIEWDTSDGYDGSDLPAGEDMDLTEVIGEIVCENLENTYGYLVKGFQIKVVDL